MTRTAGRSLANAPAWLFMTGCAALAAGLAVAAMLVEQHPVEIAVGKASFRLDGLADAAPVPAEKPSVPAAEQPATAVRQRPTKGSANAERPAKEPRSAVAKAPESAPPAAPAAPATAVSPSPPVSTPAMSAPPVPTPPSVRAGPADAGLQGSASTQSESQYGAVISGQATLGGFAFPLPPGEWRVGADVPFPRGGREMGLVRHTGKVISGIAILTHHWSAGGLGFPRGSACTRGQLRGQTEKNDDFGDQACWSTSLLPRKSLLEYQPKSATTKALRGDIDAQGLTIGSEMIVDSVIMLANTNRRVTLTVFYNPETDGFPPKKVEKIDESDWHPKNLAQHPDRTKYVRERILWASQAYQQMKQGFAVLN